MKKPIKVSTKKVRGESVKVASVYKELDKMVLLHESQSSCEITQDAKGSIKITVKAYANETRDAVETAITNFQRAKKELGI